MVTGTISVTSSSASKAPLSSVTVTKLIIGPGGVLDGTSTVMKSVIESPARMSNGPQVTVPGGPSKHDGSDAETNVVPGGRESVIMTPVASDKPVFETKIF